MKTVCVIGGGAAGLMAAYAAAKNGHRVTLFEKNEKLGKKIYITGKGRCNFTNDTPVDEFMQNIVRGGKFLTGALYTFSPQDAISFFEERGMRVKVERGNRAFPVSDHASDVTKALESACRSNNVEIRLNEEVKGVCMSDIIPMSDVQQNKDMPDIGITSDIVKIKTSLDSYAFDEVIIATGGVSYPSTGCTGDGYRFAKTFGHTITEIKPGLCGLNLKGEWFRELQGLTLKNVKITARYNNKVIYEELGEILFTHFGVSGPLILTLSSLINRLSLQEVQVAIDLKPALDEATLDKRLLRDFEKYKNKQIGNALVDLAPTKMISVLLQTSKIDDKKLVNVLTKAERLALVKTLKALPLDVNSLRNIEEAIITSGGVQLTEINPKTMESKKMKHVRFCGEVLDVDAFTGGFNLQIAFATGYLAGDSIF